MALDRTKDRSPVLAGGQAECMDTGARRLTHWEMERCKKFSSDGFIL